MTDTVDRAKALLIKYHQRHQSLQSALTQVEIQMATIIELMEWSPAAANKIVGSKTFRFPGSLEGDSFRKGE